MPRKLVPGDWCRVNDKVPDLWGKMFGGNYEPFGDVSHFLLVMSKGQKPYIRHGLNVRAEHGDYSLWYPLSALTFLFHEEEKKDE